MAEKDLIMMYAAHRAFRRDLRHLVTQPSLERWQRFSGQLSLHHSAEDTTLWPAMRSRGADPVLLDAMEAEHAEIDPSLRKVEAAFAANSPAEQKEHLTALSEALIAHLRHEETQVLPIINEREWSALDREHRRRIGLTGVRAYFSWLLEDTSSDQRKEVLGTLPAPIRLMIRGT